MLSGVLWHGLVLGSDAHLQEAQVVFWVESKRCCPRTRRIDLVSRNRAIKHNFTHWHLRRFCKNPIQVTICQTFPSCNLTLGKWKPWYLPIMISFHNTYSVVQLSSASACDWMVSQGQHVCTRKRYVGVESLSRSRKAPFSLAPADGQWQDDGDHKCTMPADLTSATFLPLFNSISLHNFPVFSHQINRDYILEQLTWN